jgi:16S rRNA G966 N2-methylase RsmD
MRYALANMDWKNQLYFGDNLKILREYVADTSVDLIYLDPPFNSSAPVEPTLGSAVTGASPGPTASDEESTAQIMAFGEAQARRSESKADCTGYSRRA